jgi:hypothetical protein
MLKFPPLMASFKGCVAVCGVDSESTTWTVKLLSPAVVGVPPMTPALLNVTPAGRAPLATDQVYAPEPPVAFKVAFMVVFTVPWASVAVVMLSGVVGVPPPPPLQPATNERTINPHTRLSKRDLISTPASFTNFFGRSAW